MNTLNQKPQTSSLTRCAVIGLGVGYGHARQYMQSPGGELVAVVDKDEDRLAARKDLGEAERFTDYREMLDKVRPDLVSVCLPNILHAPVTIDALQNGAHVLCEKPMAMNADEARAMCDAARKAGRQLGIGFSQRFGRPARAMKSVVRDGRLGDVFHAYVSWTRVDMFPRFGGWFGVKAQSGGGPLIDLGVHRIDLALWLMGYPEPVSASAAMHHRIGVPRADAEGKAFDVEDFAAGLVRFRNGASLVFEVSWGGWQREGNLWGGQDMHLVGTRGSLSQSNDKILYDFQTEQGVLCSATVSGDRLPENYAGREMVRCIRENEPFSATAEQGLVVQRILDALYRSGETGQDVAV